MQDGNKQKRLDFAREHRSDNFPNLVFTDECIVQLESHRRCCCCKQGERPRNKPRYVKLKDDVMSCRMYGLALACKKELGFIFSKVCTACLI